VGDAATSKRWLCCVCALQLLLCAHVQAAALLPARVQAQLVTKAADYDRSQASRAAPRLVLIAARAGDAESVAHARSLARELADIEKIAGAEHREEIVLVQQAADAVREIKARDAAIVYLSSGLDGEVPQIASGLAGTTVLTIGGAAGYAEKGAVLGFETVSGRVEMVVNLAQGRRQNVDFRAAFLALVRVIR
jgi:hypothetical protein